MGSVQQYIGHRRYVGSVISSTYTDCARDQPEGFLGISTSVAARATARLFDESAERAPRCCARSSKRDLRSGREGTRYRRFSELGEVFARGLGCAAGHPDHDSHASGDCAAGPHNILRPHLAAGSSNPEPEGLRCLWLARAIPLPFNTGDNLYTARLAQALVAAGASVTFMGLATSAASSRRAAEAFEDRIEWSIVPGRPNPTVLALASPLPLVAARFGTRDYSQHLNAMLRARAFDAIILDHYAMSGAIDHIERNERKGARPLIAYIAHNFETQLAADIARDFRGNLFRRAALYENARKTLNAERSLARTADIIVTLTSKDANRFASLSPLSAKLVLPPGYNGPRAPDRRIVQATPRRVVIVGAYRWTPKQINFSAFLKSPDPILQNAGIGIDVVGEAPDALRKAWVAKVKTAHLHGCVAALS